MAAGVPAGLRRAARRGRLNTTDPYTHSRVRGTHMSREAIFEASLGYFLTPVKRYLEDPTVTEIMVNGFQEVYIERRGKIESTDATFPSEDALLTAVHNVAQYVGREIDENRPI